MVDFFAQMELLLRVFWFIAIPASIVFIIQTIMTFVGMDSSDGINADFDGNFDATDAPFQLFSFRNLINFMIGFGWAGVTFWETISSKGTLVTVAFLVGAAFILIFFFLMKAVSRLAEDNSFNIHKTMGKTANVYLRIPAGKSGKGKIQISVNGTMHEIEAVTPGELIETGATVKVTKVIDESLLEVERI